VWVDGQIGLGSRRLAVIDLSPRGHQPMSNEDDTLHIAFNGEIYNFQEIRRRLASDGHTFRSDTDTEVILHLYEQLSGTVLRDLRGMFAFAIWDARDRTLFIARDRLGKKPLFYYEDARTFAFASEAKALLQDPDVRAAADPEAIHHYLTYGYVPAPGSAFRGIRKLPPGCYLTVRNGQTSVQRYWTLRYLPKRREPAEALAGELLERLREAVRLRLISDVPLGALLSGGIDSSAVVAMMRQVTTGRIQTFSIGFENPAYDERRYAREVARRFDTDHHELVVRPDAAELLPRLAWHYDEPFADSSAVPSFAVCELARRFVTVALNGDGGDESFFGYDRYLAAALSRPYDTIPRRLRTLVARATRHVPTGGPKTASYRMRRFAEVLPLDARRRYGRWLTQFDDDSKRALYTPDFAAALGAVESEALLDAAYEASDAPSFVEATVHTDVQMYLPGDLLVKMDIASMAHSLEVRSPFLDHEIVEFAASLPASLKLRGLTKKYLLKRAFDGILPPTVSRRSKMGFGVPIEHWLRDGLRNAAYDLLLSRRAIGRGYFRPDVVRRYLDEHAAGTAHHHFRLWTLLMLELWHRTFIDDACPATAPVYPLERMLSAGEADAVGATAGLRAGR
jgi:asparagine synthase (glutamine-hydrolysing)